MIGVVSMLEEQGFGSFGTTTNGNGNGGYEYAYVYAGSRALMGMEL